MKEQKKYGFEGILNFLRFKFYTVLISSEI